MAKQDNTESSGRLLAELALLRDRVARLEDTIGQMILADRQVVPPEPGAPPDSEPEPVPGAEDEAAQQGERPASITGKPDTLPLVAPPPLPDAAPEPIRPSVPATKPAAPPGRVQSLEQTIGMRWMLFVGVGVLLLSAVFFFKFAIEQGWIGPHRRVLIGAITGLAMLGAAEWAFRRGMKLYAGAIGGTGIALLYLVIFVASPNGLYAELDMLGESTTGAFLLMCLVTLIGVAAALRSDIQPTAIISLVGALATPALLSSGHDFQVVLMTYLLIVDAGFLAIAWKKAWRALLPIAMTGTGLIFAFWFAAHYPSEGLGWFVTSMFGWAFFAMFLAYGARGSVNGRISRRGAVAVTGASAAAMVLLWLAQGLHGALAGQLLVLNTIVLALCAWRHWYRLRLGVLAWTMCAMAIEWSRVSIGQSSLGPVGWSVWAWVLFALATADVMLRVFRADLPRPRRLDPALSSVAMAAMFAGTYGLLGVDYHAPMGLYAAVLGAGALALSWVVTVRRRWPGLGYAYFGQGLVLVALAVPIQFDQAMVTIAWTVQGVVAMLLARRLANRTLMGKSVALFALAMGHFLGIALRQDPRLAQIAMSVGQVDVSVGLLLATGLTAGMLAAVALLRASTPIRDEQSELALACFLTCAAAVFFSVRCVIELPHLAATWWCMAMSAGLAAWGLARRSKWLTLVGGAAVLICAAKWLMYDTLAMRVDHGAVIDAMVVMNWQFWTGLVLSAIVLAYARVLARRGRQVILSNGMELIRILDELCTALACIIVVWGGSFEIDRVFAAAPHVAWDNMHQARHMAFSLWWALWAATVLVIGFVASRPSLRYLALAVFAVTLGKVFIVDMRQVRTVYRILSFLGLGVTLLGGALLYNRRAAPPSASAASVSTQASPQDPPPEEGSP